MRTVTGSEDAGAPAVCPLLVPELLLAAAAGTAAIVLDIDAVSAAHHVPAVVVANAPPC